jgi:hypothetical protein
LQNIHDESIRGINFGIEAVSEVLAIDSEELPSRTKRDLAWLINNLSALQSALFDVRVTLDSTEKYMNSIS